jgi:hypothetical protein
LGVSDPHYFAWLTGALGRFERNSGELAAAAPHAGPPDLWVLAGARPDPAVELVRTALGGAARVRFLDRFAPGAGVERVDLNDLGALRVECCLVLVFTRVS